MTLESQRMGDVRFDEPYLRVLQAEDRAQAISRMSDVELIEALGGAARGKDPLTANVLATAVSNRHARFESVFAHMGEGVLLLGSDGRTRLLNPAFERILGWALPEMEQVPIHERLHPDCDRGAECPLVNAFLGGGEVQDDDAVMARRDGARVPVAYTISPLRRDGDLVGAVLIVRDMAEHRLATEAIARLAAIVAGSSDAIYTTTPAGVVTSWNRAAEDLFGFQPPDVMGRHASLIIPPELAGELHLVDEMVHKQGHPMTFETRRLTKSGASIYVSLSVTPIKDTKGRVVGSTVITRDVTHRKREQSLVTAALDAVPAAIVAVDETGRILLANAAAETLLGYERGDLISRSVEDLVPDELRVGHGLLRTIFAARPETRPAGGGATLHARRKDGTEVAVEIMLTPVRPLGSDGLVVIATLRQLG